MRLLAFTDLHDDPAHYATLKEKAKRADALICCGDFTYFERDHMRVAQAIHDLGKPVFLVHGNHESPALVERMAKRFSNIIPVHNQLVSHGDLTFLGFGGLGFTTTAPEFDAFVRKNATELAKAKNLILITHQPPQGTVLDELYGDYVGNASFTEFVKKHQPRAHLCGHIEENSYKKQFMGKSLLLNPGPEGRFINIGKRP